MYFFFLLILSGNIFLGTTSTSYVTTRYTCKKEKEQEEYALYFLKGYLPRFNFILF